MASFKQVVPEFAQAVNDGKYKTRSISVYPDGTIRHLGFLGAKSPAIKGLANFQFEESEEAEVYDFSELNDYKFDVTASIFQKIRDFFIEKFNLETADKIITTYNIESLKELENKTPEEVNQFCDSLTEQDGKEQILPNEENNGIQNFEEELQKRNEIIENLRKEKAALEESSRKAKYLDFAEQSVKDGNITPAQKDLVVDFMEAAYQADIADNQDFSEADENTVSNKFKKFVKGLKQIDYKKINNEQIDETNTINFSDAEELSERISQTVAEAKSKGITLSESQALQKLKRQ